MDPTRSLAVAPYESPLETRERLVAVQTCWLCFFSWREMKGPIQCIAFG